ncbi:MAG: alpha/beta hydrolase [Candidatus Nanopelagicales bacterium]
MPLSLESMVTSAQHVLARASTSLPTPVATKLGGGVRVVDGQTLDPQLSVLLEVESRINREDEGRSVAERRAGLSRSARIAAGARSPIGPVRDLTVRGADGVLRARHYRPAGGGDGRPLVVYFHGGGWVVGDIETHDQSCRLIAKHADVHVLSVDYRLAPEHPFPAPVEDAVASFTWAVEHAADLGADARRVAVAGDSAGGNLAAVVSQLTKDSSDQPPYAQLLVYPGADASKKYPSKDLFGEGYLLTKATMDWYVDTYAGSADRFDPRLSPIHAKDLSGLPPTVLTTAAFDPIRDEGEAYADALRESGVQVVHRRAAGLVHGYFGMTGIHRASLEESLAVIGAFSAVLETAAPQG